MRASRRDLRRRTPRQEDRRFAIVTAALLIAGPLSVATATAAESNAARDTTRAQTAATAKPAEVSSTTAKPSEVSSTTAKSAEVSATTTPAKSPTPVKNATPTNATAPAKAAAPAAATTPAAKKAATTTATAAKAPAAPAKSPAGATKNPAAPAATGTAAQRQTPPADATKRGTPVATGAAPTDARSAAATSPVKTARTQSATPSVAVRQVSPPQPAPVEDRVNYQYNALGRRDPFQPLVGGGFVPADVAGAPPDVGGLKVVGIVWGAEDKFALIEDPRGNSMVLRKGDKVMNGVVETLRRDAVVVKLTVDGSTDLLEIPLTRKGESNENR